MASFVGLAAALASGISCLSDRVCFFFAKKCGGCSLFSSKMAYMDVAKNRGTPKWMVYFMENPIKIDDLGVPFFWETPI